MISFGGGAAGCLVPCEGGPTDGGWVRVPDPPPFEHRVAGSQGIAEYVLEERSAGTAEWCVYVYVEPG